MIKLDKINVFFNKDTNIENHIFKNLNLHIEKENLLLLSVVMELENLH
jgi:ABC-type uncharacterized transport system ATPase component